MSGTFSVRAWLMLDCVLICTGLVYQTQPDVFKCSSKYFDLKSWTITPQFA